MCFCGKTVLLLCPTVDWALAEVWETKILWQVLSLQLNGGSYQYSARNSHFPLLETTHPKFRQVCLFKRFLSISPPAMLHNVTCIFISLSLFNMWGCLVLSKAQLWTFMNGYRANFTSVMILVRGQRICSFTVFSISLTGF